MANIGKVIENLQAMDEQGATVDEQWEYIIETTGMTPVQWKKAKQNYLSFKLKRPESILTETEAQPTHPYIVPKSVARKAAAKNFLQGMIEGAWGYVKNIPPTIGSPTAFVPSKQTMELYEAQKKSPAPQIPFSAEENIAMQGNPFLTGAAKTAGEILNPFDMILMGRILKAGKAGEELYKGAKGMKELSLAAKMAKGGAEVGAFDVTSNLLKGQTPSVQGMLQGAVLGAGIPLAGKGLEKIKGVISPQKEAYLGEDIFKGLSEKNIGLEPSFKKTYEEEAALKEYKRIKQIQQEIAYHEKSLTGLGKQVKKQQQIYGAAYNALQNLPEGANKGALQFAVNEARSKLKTATDKLNNKQSLIADLKSKLELPPQTPQEIEAFFSKQTEEAMQGIKKAGEEIIKLPETKSLPEPKINMPIPEGGITPETVKVTKASIVTQRDVMEDVANFTQSNPEKLLPYFKLEKNPALHFQKLMLEGRTKEAGKYLTLMARRGDLPRITTIAAEMIRKGEIPLSELPSVQRLISEHGNIHGADDAASWLLAQTKTEGRGLGTQTLPALRIRQAVLGMNLPENIPLTVWDKMRMKVSLLPIKNQDVMDFWKQSLVSRVYTQTRNYATTQYLMLGKIIEDAAVDTVSAVTGKVAPKDALLASWENVRAMMPKFDRRGWQTIEKILAEKPYENQRLFGRLGDITRGGAVSKFLNPLAEIQEFATRKQVFGATLFRDLRLLGLDPVNIDIRKLEANKPLYDKFLQAIEHGVDESLKYTFASEVGADARAIIKLMTFYPDDSYFKVITKTFGNVIMPFPRFMVQNAKMFYETLPGIDLLSRATRGTLPKTQEELVRMAAKNSIGATLFATAWYILSNPEMAGEKWYQVKVDGKNFDMRPFPLLSTYLFLADMGKTVQMGGMESLDRRYDIKDIIAGVSGMNRIGGTTSFLIDAFRGQKLDTAWENMKRIMGDFAAGFTTPAQNIRIAMQPFSEEEQYLRSTKEEPLTKPLVNIPYASRKLPVSPSIFGEGGMKVDKPLFGKEDDVKGKLFGAFQRMVGLVGKDEPELEKEMNRIGMQVYYKLPSKNDLQVEGLDLTKRYNISPETFKRLLTEEMDKLMQSPEWIAKVKSVLIDPKYDVLPDDMKATALGELIFEPLKKAAKENVFAPFETKYQQQESMHVGGGN